MKTERLYQAGALSARRFSDLRRIACAEQGATVARRYFFTARAAENVADHPQVLLFDRIHGHDQGRVVMYEQDGGPLVCKMMGRTDLCLGKAGTVLEENICVAAPDEKILGEPEMLIPFTEDHPFPLLPFDLALARDLMEQDLKGELLGYKSGQYPGAIYRSSCPFDVYQTFLWLAGRAGELSARIQGLRRIMEVGSGLGCASFILSQFLPQAEEITGAEIDPVLAAHSARLKSYLQRKFNYDLSRVSLRRLDIYQPTAEIGRYDAVIGWFPMDGDKNGARLLPVLRQLKQGALFFQLYTGCPLSTLEDTPELGFRQIEIRPPHYIAASVFERIG